MAQVDPATQFVSAPEDIQSVHELEVSQLQDSDAGPASSLKDQDRGGKPNSAQALDPEQVSNESCRAILIRAKSSWLRNTDVVEILQKHKEYGLLVSQEPPHMPNGGTLWLFDKKRERYFRRDGHQWRKKPNGKTVRETHEKLKVDNKDVLNCYYTHSEDQDTLQRRCYWLLENDEGIVLVHYLNAGATRNRSGVAPVTSKSSMQSKSGGAQLGPPPNQVGPPTPRDWGNLTQIPPPDLFAPLGGSYGNMMTASMDPSSIAMATLRNSMASAQTAIGSAFRPTSMTSLMDPNARIQNPGAKHQTALFQAIDAQNQPITAGAEATEERRIATDSANREKAGGNSGWQPSSGHDEDREAASGSADGQDGQDITEEDDTLVDPNLRSSKRRKTEASGQPSLDARFIQLADHFQSNSLELAKHLEELRKGDRKFWQDLLTLERERIAVERDSFTAIAAAIVGHLTGLSSSQAPPAGGPPPPQGSQPYRSGAFNTGNRPQGRQDQAWDQSSIAREPQRRQ